MQTLIRRPNAPMLFGLMALAGFVIFGIATGVLMAEPAQVVGDQLSKLTCLQVAFTPERYKEVFFLFTPEGQQAILSLLVPGDIVFAWGYGFLLAGLMGLLVIRLPGKWQRWGAWFLWAPLLATVLDCVEDIFLFTIATQLVVDPATVIAAALPLLAGLAAVSKYVALSAVSPIFGIAAIVKGLTYDRSVGAIILYLALGLLLISMVLRPLQQVPACF